MKKTAILAFLLIFFVACSSDDSSPNPADLFTQQSPWIFDHYELLNVLDQGNSNMTVQELETEMNNSLDQISLDFNEDGSGSTLRNGEPTVSWEWQINSQNELQLIFDDNEVETFKNLNVISNSMSMEMESVTYDAEANFEVSHYGKAIFK